MFRDAILSASATPYQVKIEIDVAWNNNCGSCGSSLYLSQTFNAGSGGSMAPALASSSSTGGAAYPTSTADASSTGRAPSQPIVVLAVVVVVVVEAVRFPAVPVAVVAADLKALLGVCVYSRIQRIAMYD